MYGPMPQGRMFCARAVEYSGLKLNLVPLQLNGSVFMKPLAADAIMYPRCPVVRSVSLASSACPPGVLALNIRTMILSPGFISKVCEFGVTVALSASCGLGGPVGTPFVWMKAKLTGSMQLLLHEPDPSPVHSKLSMLSAEHQCLLSQLMLSENGAKPGG